MSQMTKVKTALDSVRFPALCFQTDKFNSGKTKKVHATKKSRNVKMWTTVAPILTSLYPNLEMTFAYGCRVLKNAATEQGYVISSRFMLGVFFIRLLTLCLGQKMSGIVSWTHAAATQKLTYCHAKPVLLPRCTFTTAMLHLYDCHTESLATATLNLHYCHVESLSTATLNLHYCHADSLITATANLHYCHAEPLLTTAPHNSGQVCKYT